MSAAPRPRRLLVISFSYAPMLHARAFRWTALTRHFASRGWEVDVLTSWQPGAAESVAGTLRIHRVGWRWAENLRNLLQRRRGQTAASGASAHGAGSRLLHAIRSVLWQPFYWPDSSCFWYWPAKMAALRLVREKAHDVVVSVTPTFTGALVGESVHRAHPDVRWVLDVGDPFSLQVHAAANNVRLYGALNRRVERRLLSEADAISVTTSQAAARYAEAFPESAGKIQVIPPLFSLPDEPLAASSGSPGALRFVYVGTLYRKLREPGFLLQIFDALLKRMAGKPLELHLFGDTHQFADLLVGWRQRLGDALQVHGSVPRAEVAAAIEEAAVLVNIGNRSEDQLPSKVVEYVASGKPILNIASAEGDLSAAFLRTYPDKLLLHDAGAVPSAEQIGELERFCGGLPRRVDEREVQALLEPYTLPRIASAYETLFA